jgi:RNA polymerase sigma factor (sigma-70 family)
VAIGLNFPTVLDAARTGADWAWTTLYRDLAPAVLSYLRMNGTPDAEDLTQEVFVAVVRGLNEFEGNEDNFRSWVFVIAHRRMQDGRRHAGRHPVDAAPTERLERPGGNVEDEALESVETDRVRAMFQALVPDQRDVLLLRIVAGLSVNETAEVVGKTAGAVKQLQRRGLAALQRTSEKQAVTR